MRKGGSYNGNNYVHERKRRSYFKYQNRYKRVNNGPTPNENQPMQEENRPVQIKEQPIQDENQQIVIENRPIQVDEQKTQIENRVDEQSIPVEERTIRIENHTVQNECHPIENQNQVEMIHAGMEEKIAETRQSNDTVINQIENNCEKEPTLIKTSAAPKRSFFESLNLDEVKTFRPRSNVKKIGADGIETDRVNNNPVHYSPWHDQGYGAEYKLYYDFAIPCSDPPSGVITFEAKLFDPTNPQFSNRNRLAHLIRPWSKLHFPIDNILLNFSDLSWGLAIKYLYMQSHAIPIEAILMNILTVENDRHYTQLVFFDPQSRELIYHTVISACIFFVKNFGWCSLDPKFHMHLSGVYLSQLQVGQTVLLTS